MFSSTVISNLILIFHVLMWVASLLLYQFIKKQFDSGSLILGSYLFYSIMSLLLYNSPFFYFEEIKLFPYIYSFLILMIAFFPILVFDVDKLIKIDKPSNVLLYSVSLVFIVASFIQLPSIVSNFTKNIVQLLLISSAGQDLYEDALVDSYSIGDGSIANLPSIITNAYGNFGILLFFYYLTLKHRNSFVIIALFISNIIGILGNISLGQRGPIIEIIFSFVVTYFTLRKYFQSSVNKILRTIGLVFLIVSIIPIIALTNSRFGDTIGGARSSVYFYAGQQNLIFNNYGLDNGGIRYGDRVFPFFKRLMGFENVPKNFWERRNKYPNLIVNDEVFIGFIGDFTLDFGPYLTPILFLLFSGLVYFVTRTRNKILLFHHLILLHFLLTVIMLGGIKLYPYSDLGGNLQLIVYFLAYLIFKLDYDSRQAKLKFLQSR